MCIMQFNSTERTHGLYILNMQAEDDQDGMCWSAQDPGHAWKNEENNEWLDGTERVIGQRLAGIVKT